MTPPLVYGDVDGVACAAEMLYALLPGGYGAAGRAQVVVRYGKAHVRAAQKPVILFIPDDGERLV
jgi:hypothetical protein